MTPVPVPYEEYSDHPHPHEQTNGQGQEQMQDSDLNNSNIDAYIAAHLERFEESKRKWADCSVEEWKAGADGETPFIFRSLSTEWLCAFLQK